MPIYKATKEGASRGEVLRATDNIVRLDNDLQRGAFGLTADKTSKVAGRDKQPGTGKRGARGHDPHVANALRNAYEEAVGEDVPQEFLDLLGKLT
jgi:hypothetical protein